MKKTLIKLFLTFSLVFLLVVPVSAQIDKAFGGSGCSGEDCVDSAFDGVVTGSGYQKDANSPEVIISTILYYSFGFLGIIFIGLTMYGGIQWMLGGKGGKEKQIEKGKQIIKGAIIGLVIVMAAYAITWFIFNILVINTLTMPENDS